MLQRIAAEPTATNLWHFQACAAFMTKTFRVEVRPTGILLIYNLTAMLFGRLPSSTSGRCKRPATRQGLLRLLRRGDCLADLAVYQTQSSGPTPLAIAETDDNRHQSIALLHSACLDLAKHTWTQPHCAN